MSFACVSCQTSRLLKDGHSGSAWKDPSSGYFYYNDDKYKVCTRFFSDYLLTDTLHLSNKEKGMILRQLPEFMNKHRKRVLLKGRTIVEPYFAFHLIYCPDAAPSAGILSKLGFVMKNGGKHPFFYKLKPGSASLNGGGQFIMQAKMGYFFMLVDDLVKDPLDPAVGQLTLDEYSDIITASDFTSDTSHSCVAIDPWDLVNDAFYKKEDSIINYMEPLMQLKMVLPEVPAGQKISFYQALATCYSFIGSTDSAQYYEKLAAEGSSDAHDCIDSLLATRPDPGADTFILGKAAVNRVLLFNEGHSSPSHRYFVSSLLGRLYALGYRYLALEALGYDDDINSRGYPEITSGFYTLEPEMANLIRNAHQMGFTLVSYEDTLGEAGIPRREYYQAMNLYNQTFRKDNNAKLIVLAGYDHIIKPETGMPVTGKKWMASWFQEISGINPFRINQSLLMDHSLAGNRADSEGASYLLPERMPAGRCRDQMAQRGDIFIIHGKKAGKVISSRLSASRIDTLVKIDSSLLPGMEKKELLISFYQEEEALRRKRAVPVYIRLLPPGANSISLNAAKGNYIMIVQDRSGRMVYRKDMCF
jgi:hypothetical protein